MKISQNKSVSLSYDLHVGDGQEERVLMERATEEHPLQFIYGTNQMLPAFEKELDSLQKGDTFSFTLTPEEAYGEYSVENEVELPRNIFEVDGKLDENVVKVDATLPMMDSNGNRINGTVMEITDTVIKMNFNHPLAGETLHFSGKVLDVRETTPEEIAALFGGGCGCGGCGCHDEDEPHEDHSHGGSCGSGCGCGH